MRYRCLCFIRHGNGPTIRFRMSAHMRVRIEVIGFVNIERMVVVAWHVVSLEPQNRKISSDQS